MNNTVKNWIALTPEEALAFADSLPAGLAEAEAKARLEKFGPNILPEKKQRLILKIIWNQFNNPFAYILAIAGLLSLLLGSAVDAVIVFAALILNAAIGFFQEWRAANIFRALKKFVSYRAVVRRDGKLKNIDTKELVPGDILILKSGERIPADARLIKISNLKTNEAVLTGESDLVEKTLAILPETTALADRKNFVFLGTFIEDGVGEAVVTATGARTEFGKITALVLGLKEEVTPLQVKIKKLARLFGVVFVAVSFLLFVVGFAAGRDFFEMFLTAVAVAVAAVPESLPIALTIALAVGARKIYQKGGLIKRLLAAEGLGNTDVILADKTATLTEGKIAITKLITNEREFTPDQFEAGTLLEMLALTSEAIIENREEPKESWRIFGHPIDKAVLLAALTADIDDEKLRENQPRLDEIPFDASYKYSATLNRFDSKENVVIVFGAPEAIISLSENPPDWAVSKMNDLTKEGFRVLALGIRKTKDAKISRQAISSLSFLSLVVFSDPIRKDVGEAIKTAREAGIRTVILTGDHLQTANFVGRELGILKAANRSIEEAALPANPETIIDDYDVFARITPITKLNLVTAFKNKGHNVAMIGDGVNDAPALIQANLGVAVGSGTDVARETADLILLHDSFSVIVEAIRQGRIILANIKKTVTFLLSGAFTEIILIGGSILLGLPLALLPAQILWVNIIEDGLPAMAFAFESEENNVMKEKPEKRNMVLTRPMKKFIVSFALIADLTLFFLFYVLFKNTGDIDYARTMTFGGLGLTSLFYVFSIKNFSRSFWQAPVLNNRFLNVSVIIGFALYLLAFYAPPLQNIFGTVSIRLLDWLILLGLSFFNVLLIEVSKRFFWGKNSI